MDEISWEKKCGTSYNLYGQRLRDDWYEKPSNRNEVISDLDG